MSAYTANWSLMTPEIVLAVLALVIFTVDFMTGIKGKKPFLGRMSILALLVTAVLVFITNKQTGAIGEIFIVDRFAMVFKLIILISVAMVIAISMHYLEKNKDMYQGEFYSLMLFATLGAMLMVSSADLVTLFVGLELLSISAYCLVGLKKFNRKSTEGAIKYIVLGGTASAFILYGMSFLYGLTGSTSLIEIGMSINSLYVDYPYIVLMSIVLMLVGFGFKISVVPFHMWAPDVYEGAPTPVTAYLSVVSKIAAFGIVLRIFILSFGSIFEEWSIIFAVIATITMIVGNFIALTQKNIKRLMAYSGVAQAGYLLVPIASTIHAPYATLSIIAFYAVAYLLMVLGAFAIITLVTEDAGKEDISSFKGLYKRSPYMAIAMAVFLISLAGLPFTAGFFGKAYIFFGAVTGGDFWLAAVMIAASIVSFYYYFGIIKQMFMRDPNEADGEVVAEADSQLRAPVGISTVVTICLAVTVILGILPGILTNVFNSLNWMGMM